MFREIFRKRFKIGDKVRLIRTGQKAVISDKGNLLLAKKTDLDFCFEVRKRQSLHDGDAGGY
jgi:hypothetical protein